MHVASWRLGSTWWNACWGKVGGTNGGVAGLEGGNKVWFGMICPTTFLDLPVACFTTLLRV
jgi:hypothetical protein